MNSHHLVSHVGNRITRVMILFAILICFLLTSCSGIFSKNEPSSDSAGGYVLAVESFLADIARNVAGERMTVESLIPFGVDPHSYQPAPLDILKVANSSLVIINGGGIETFLSSLLENAGGSHLVVVGSEGLAPITRQDDLSEIDPHFWLDPVLVIRYTENIRDGLIKVDPKGEPIYRSNAEIYIQSLMDLDEWIKGQVETIPPDKRKLITNHDSLGYFASRYGFEVIGSLIPGLSSEASPTSREMINLVNQIRTSKAPAIFMEIGASTYLAEQIYGETNVLLVTDLYIGSLSAPKGPASTYIDMMIYNVNQIVNALR